jgi:hypothetical protein
MISISVVVVIMIFVAIFPHFMAVPVCLVAIAVSISIPRYLAPAVPAVVAVMITDYRALISRKAPVEVVGIVIVSPAVVSVVIVPDAVAETRIISEARFILPTPFPIFPLALTVEPVVFHIVIPALGKPFPIIRIVVSVVAAVPPVSVIGIVSIMVLRASRG